MATTPNSSTYSPFEALTDHLCQIKDRQDGAKGPGRAGGIGTLVKALRDHLLSGAGRWPVINDTGSDIDPDMLVGIVGYDAASQCFKIDLADKANNIPAIGISGATILDGTQTYVDWNIAKEGIGPDLSGGGVTVGDPLFLGTAGAFTHTPNSNSSHTSQAVGYVQKKGNPGDIRVLIQPVTVASDYVAIIGALGDLDTTDKTNIVAAINEVYAVAAGEPPSVGLGFFGDGSDGAISITNNVAAIAGICSKASATDYTLLRDVCASNFTLGTGVTLHTGGFGIYYTGTATITGTLQNDGGAGVGGGSGGAGGSAGAGGHFGAGGAGGAGGDDADVGADGTATTVSLGAAGGAGGTDIGGAHAAGAGGTATAPTAAQGTARILSAAATGMLIGNPPGLLTGGGGGGGGAAAASSTGGGGGGGGGVIVLCGKTLALNGAVRSAGGAGGAGSGASAGGGGGGGGGLVVLIYDSVSGSGTASAPGGAAGALAGTGLIGTAGSAGTVIRLHP